MLTTRRAFTQSIASCLSRSPAECYDKYVAETWTDEEPGENLILGSMLHCMALQPTEFGQKYGVRPRVDGRTKEGKAAIAAAEAAGPEVQWVKADLFDRARECMDALLGNDWVEMLLTKAMTKAKVETFIEWELEGIRCGGTPDAVFTEGDLIIDLKTTKDARPSEFAKSVASFGYARQAAWYRYGCQQTYGMADSRFVFVVVKTSAPFEVAVYELDERAIATGFDEMVQLCLEWKYRHTSGNWKANWQTGINTISLPRWYEMHKFSENEYEVEL